MMKRLWGIVLSGIFIIALVIFIALLLSDMNLNKTAWRFIGFFALFPLGFMAILIWLMVYRAILHPIWRWFTIPKKQRDYEDAQEKAEIEFIQKMRERGLMD